MGGRRVALLLAVLIVAAIAPACLPPPPPPALSITTTPGLFPAFSESITDHVSRCATTPVQVSVVAPSGTYVSVADSAWTTGTFTATVTRGEGQTFTIAVLKPWISVTTHYVRCLPDDFPQWNAAHTGATGSAWYIANLVRVNPSYPIIFDPDGIPVWWGPPQSAFTTLLPDGNVAFMVSTGVEERGFDGSLIRSLATVNGPPDGHDVLLLPNGDFVMVANVVRSGVDLTPIGGPADTSILDQVVEEIDPSDGHLVWSWDTADHIPVTSMDPQWRDQYVVNGTAPFDVFHWNSIEPTGSGFILSYRHLDAIYKIDETTGDIVWKLGGSAQAESLTVADDPVFTAGSHFGGQHDARLLADGTLTLFDDGSNLGRSPRAVRYAIDETAHTATLLESVEDGGVTASVCCGSARRMADNDWVIGWGGTNTATENVGNERHFEISFGTALVYRFTPVPAGVLDRDALRAAMDAQYGSGTAAVQSAPAKTPFP